MSLYSYNDWRDYLQHSWGTSPKMKQAEKEYNAKYYQEHKDEILKNRREKKASREEFDDQSDYKFRGRKITSEDDLHKRASEEEDEAARLIEENDKIGGYSDDVMENVRKHNEQVKKNIEELTATVNDYINSHPELSDDERKALADSLTKQIDRAHTQMIDLSTDSGKKYVNDLLGNKSSGSSSKSSSSAQNKAQTDSGTGTASNKNKQFTREVKQVTSTKKASSEVLKKVENSQADKQAMKDTVDFYKGNKSKINDENGAAQDLGEFLAEYGENGGSDLSGQKAVNEWKKFRKELGLETSDKKVENSARDLGRRQTAYQQEERKKR